MATSWTILQRNYRKMARPLTILQRNYSEMASPLKFYKGIIVKWPLHGQLYKEV